MSLPSVPRLPTDNLYKFAAIAGVLVFIASWVGPAVAYSRFEETVWERQRDLDLLDIQRAADSLGKELLATEERTNTSAEHARRLDSLRLRIDSTSRETVTLMARVREAKAAERWLWIYVALGFVFSVTGFITATWGFRRWYTRLQRPLDEWVKKHGGPPAGVE